MRPIMTRRVLALLLAVIMVLALGTTAFAQENTTAETEAPAEAAAENTEPEETTGPEQAAEPEETIEPEEAAGPEDTTEPEEAAGPEETESPADKEYAPTDEGDSGDTIDALQARIDALPSAAELEAMDEDALDTVYAEVCAIFDIYYDELTEEEAGALDISRLEEAAAFFTQALMTLDDSDVVAVIGDGDDKTEYTTLAAAVEAAKDGDVITLVADTQLDETITLSGKSITLTAESAYKITGDSSLITLMEISEGAALTMSGSVVVDGTGMGYVYSYSYSDDPPDAKNNGIGAAFNVHGKLTLKDSVAIQNFEIGQYTGVINVCGSAAVLNIEGGAIKDNHFTPSGSYYNARYHGYRAPIRVEQNATVNMTGGEISENTIPYSVKSGYSNVTSESYAWMDFASGGIFAYGPCTVNISGGTITNNTAFYGSAITLCGGSTCKISGNAVISNNTCGYYTDVWVDYGLGTNNPQFYASGAVFIYGSTLYLSGGTITNNKGGNGGGITLSNYWDDDGAMTNTAFYMTGGTVSGNSAAASGGGIYAYTSGDVLITGGSITNNTAGILGGGLYCEGNEYYYTTVTLKNVLVTGNTACIEGGGLWTCPTGNTAIYVTDGGAIYGNTAEFDSEYYADANETGAAGDDVVSGSQNSFSLTLATRILGGGAVLYYPDGAVCREGDWNYPRVDSSTSRYEADAENTEAVDAGSLVKSTDYWALKSQTVGATLAADLASVTISGNKAAYGGGIATNGGVVIGTDSPLIDISVKKVWNDNDDSANVRPDSVTVYLKNKGTVIDSATLNEDNDWTYTFEDLPNTEGYQYTIGEASVEDYKTVITGDTEKGFTITNTCTRTGGLTVSKTVSGSGASSNQEFHFTVTLYTDDTYKTVSSISGVYGDMTFENGTASFTLKANERATASGLPEGTGYIVEEDSSAYTQSVTSGNLTGAIAAGKTAAVTVNNAYETIDISGSKTWDDGDDQDGKRPEFIIIRLLAGGKETDHVTVTAQDDWAYSFTGLAKYGEDGKEIRYTISEDAVSGYSATYDAYDIINSYTPGQTSITVTKAWDDGDDADGLRPESVTIILLADGEDTGKTLTLSEDNNWTGSFTGLDEYKDGVKIVYAIEEDSIDGYTAAVTGDAATGFVVKNSHTPTATPAPTVTPTVTPETTPTTTPEATATAAPSPVPATAEATPTATPNKAPATGDGTNIALYASVTLLCLAALSALILRRKYTRGHRNRR